MLGGLGQTSFEVSISGLAATGCGAVSVFFFFLSPPNIETGKTSPRISRITSAASDLPLRFDLGGNISLLSCSCLSHVKPVLVAVVAERHVVLLVFYQQIGLRRRVRLMAAQASQVSLDFGYIQIG